MGNEAEKVYVALGNDAQDGISTLEWALAKWPSPKITFVILHANIIKDYVYTYYGKLPASYVNDEKVDLLRKLEQGRIDNILREYVNFCGMEKAETLYFENYEEPIHKRILQIIWRLRISKLVMGIAFFKSSSWNNVSPLTGLKHIQQMKPDFCELYSISGGKLFYLNEEFIEDDQGVMVAKVNKKRASFKTWIAKMFPENAKSTSSSTTPESPLKWEQCVDEIEEYFKQLIDFKVDENGFGEASNAILENPNSNDPNIPKDMSPAERTEFLKVKIREAKDLIRSRRREAKESADRCTKAEWAITLCSSKAEDLEARLYEEIKKRGNMEKDVDTMSEEIGEIRSEVEQKKSRLDSTLEIQRELSNKLKSSAAAKSQAQDRLKKMIHKRAGMVQEIEKLRKQRDVMRQRIEFCREKDAIEMATRLGDLSFRYKEFTADEIEAATQCFSESRRMKYSGGFTNVYRGRINYMTVAVKLYDAKQVSKEDFDRKVKVLSCLQHPHLVAMLGFCTHLRCIVFEYMHQGCLQNVFSSRKPLDWHARVRLLAQVSSALGFLHLTNPKPVVHGNLNLSSVLLDRNNVAKVHGLRLDFSNNESNVKTDVEGFGNLVLQLLTGRSRSDFLHDVIVNNQVLDGEWPSEVATELGRIAIRCLSAGDGYTRMTDVTKEIEEVRRTADRHASATEVKGSARVADTEDRTMVPSNFFCPILHDIMENPHVASDGFSYEHDAIKQWLDMGRDTSPMTNEQLKHRHLTPNRTLRLLIQDWHNKRSVNGSRTNSSSS